jgi:hypothetical protein
MLTYLALLDRRRLEVLHLLVPLSQLRLQPRNLALLLLLLRKQRNYGDLATYLSEILYHVIISAGESSR